MPDSRTQVAFIGLGIMGEPMAKRLLEKEIPLAVYDIQVQARARFSGTPARVAESLAKAVSGTDVVILMLPDSHAVEVCCFAEDGIVEHLKPGALIINMSTADLGHTQDQARRLLDRGFCCIDAPVGRTRHHARTGDLLALVGAEPEDLKKALPLLSAMASDVEHVGPPGSGLKLKLVNNYLGMIGMAMTAEALALADRLGLDREVVVRCLSSTSAGRGQLVSTFPGKVLKGDLEPDFPLAMGRKDLQLGLALAIETGVPAELGKASSVYFQSSKDYGRDGQDCTAMLLLLHDLAAAGELASS